MGPRVVVAPDNEAVLFIREVIEERRKEREPARPSFITDTDRTGTEGITEDDVPTLKRPLLQAFQDNLRAGMQRLQEGKDWLPFDAETVAPKLIVKRRDDGTLGRSYYAGPILPVLLGSAVDLLAQY